MVCNCQTSLMVLLIGDIIDSTTIRLEVIRLANESPDAVYPSNEKLCSYLHGKCGNGNGCLVGQAIQNLYPKYFELHPDVIEDTGVQSLPELTKVCKSWLEQIQLLQDACHPWGECLKEVQAQFGY